MNIGVGFREGKAWISLFQNLPTNPVDFLDYDVEIKGKGVVGTCKYTASTKQYCGLTGCNSGAGCTVSRQQLRGIRKHTNRTQRSPPLVISRSSSRNGSHAHRWSLRGIPDLRNRLLFTCYSHSCGSDRPTHFNEWVSRDATCQLYPELQGARISENTLAFSELVFGVWEHCQQRSFLATTSPSSFDHGGSLWSLFARGMARFI
jgi:hypothetical protein